MLLCIRTEFDSNFGFLNNEFHGAESSKHFLSCPSCDLATGLRSQRLQAQPFVGLAPALAEGADVLVQLCLWLGLRVERRASTTHLLKDNDAELLLQRLWQCLVSVLEGPLEKVRV